MKVAVIVTTYNSPKSLELCLRAMSQQSRQPDQIIVCDDGSGEETRELIDSLSSQLPLIHAWHEDIGFRAARSRNNGLRYVESDYVISLDGDMVMHEDFIRDHLSFAKVGTFVQGSRVFLSREFSEAVMMNPKSWEWDRAIISKGCMGNSKNLIRSSFLRWLCGLKAKSCGRKARTCNMAFWMKDLRAVNGFDNRYEGWGREDSDLACRLVHLGLKMRKLKHAAVALHLYHPENTRDSLAQNEAMLKFAITNEDYYRCKCGIEELG